MTDPRAALLTPSPVADPEPERVRVVVDGARSLSDRERHFWLTRRRAIILELVAIEEFLGMARTVPSTHAPRAGARAR